MTGFVTMPAKLIAAVRQRGIRTVARLGLLMMRGRIMAREDRKYAGTLWVDTESISLDKLNIESDHGPFGFTHVPTRSRVIDCYFASLPGDLSEFTFVDLGSGKGAALLLAARREFKDVVGIEFSEQLHEIALSNIRHATNAIRFPCQSIRSLNGDAADYLIPRGDVVLFLHNPFSEEVMQKVIGNIEEAYHRENRDIYVLYYQLKREELEHATRNIDLLSEVAFLLKHDVAYRSWADRFVLGSHLLAAFRADS